MANQIPDVTLTAAKNNQHDEFMRDTLQNAQRSPGVTHYMPQRLEAFRLASDAEHELVSRPLRWLTTPEITEADNQRDGDVTALRYAMWAAARNPSPEIKAAAEVVLRMSEIDKIDRHQQYDEQTGKINAMLTTLQGQYAEEVLAAGLKPYVDQLRASNDRFCLLVQQRDLAQGEAGPRDTERLRRETDQAYRTLILGVNSVAECYEMQLLAEQPAQNPLTTFIDYMCGHIERYRREVLSRRTSSESTESSESSESTETEVEEEETLTRK